MRYLSAAVAAARELLGVEGFEPLSWSGWQHEASRERNLPVLTDGERALLRSQSGSGVHDPM